MSDATNEDSQLRALEAAGIDLDSFSEAMRHEGARTFVSEVAQAAEEMGMLILNASLYIGQRCAEATLGQGTIWLDYQVYGKDAVDAFATLSTSGNAGLVGCTPTEIAAMKVKQTDEHFGQGNVRLEEDLPAACFRCWPRAWFCG